MVVAVAGEFDPYDDTLLSFLLINAVILLFFQPRHFDLNQEQQWQFCLLQRDISLSCGECC